MRAVTEPGRHALVAGAAAALSIAAFVALLRIVSQARADASQPSAADACGRRQSLGHRKHDGLRRAVELAHAASAERCSRAITSRTSTSGADAPAVTPTRALPVDPARVELVGAIDHVRGNAAVRGDLAQAVRVRAVGAADDDHDVDLRRHELDRVLPVLRRVADVVLLRTDDARKALLQRLDDGGGVVDRQRRLRDVRKVRRGRRRRDASTSATDSTRWMPPSHCPIVPSTSGWPRVADHHDLASVVAHLAPLRRAPW